jgi:hypothetical protein
LTEFVMRAVCSQPLALAGLVSGGAIIILRRVTINPWEDHNLGL